MLIFVYNPSHPLFSRLKGFLYSFSLTQVLHTPPTANLMENPPSLIWLYYLIHHSLVPAPLGTSGHNDLHLQLKWKPTPKRIKPSHRLITLLKLATSLTTLTGITCYLWMMLISPPLTSTGASLR